MARTKVVSYSFNPSTRAVTVNGFGTTLSKYGLTSVRNIRTGETYYTRDQHRQLSVSGQVFTLPSGVIQAPARTTDSLDIYFDPEVTGPEVTSGSGDAVAISSIPGLSGTLAKKVDTVTYSGSLSTARPTADAVYWVGFPSTPTNAQAQDIVEGSQDADLTALAALGDGYPRRSGGAWAARTAAQLKADLGIVDLLGNSLWSAGGAEPFGREQLGASTLTASTATFSYFTAPIANIITKLAVATNAAGASAGITLCRLGLYTVDGSGNLTLVARTANTTTIGNASDTLFSTALNTTGGFPASYTFIPGQRYAFAVLQVGTTPSALMGQTSFVGGIYTTPPQVNGRVFSQSDLATSYTAATVGTYYWTPWVAGIA